MYLTARMKIDIETRAIKNAEDGISMAGAWYNRDEAWGDYYVKVQKDWLKERENDGRSRD